jgi:hypothetical protein
MRDADPNQGRVLKFIFLLDDKIRSITEHGLSRDGRATGTRQMVRRMLRKTVVIEGVGEVAACRLYQPPEERWANKGDTFDRDQLLDDTGGWRLPSKQWLEIRERMIKARDEERAQAAEQARRSLSADLADKLTNLAAMSSPAAPAPAARGAR